MQNIVLLKKVYYLCCLNIFGLFIKVDYILSYEVSINKFLIIKIKDFVF